MSAAVTEESMQWPVKDEDSDLVPVHHQPKERPADTVIVDDYDRPVYSEFPKLFLLVEIQTKLKSI